MTRHASVIEVLPGQLAEYKRLHAAVWLEVLNTIRRANITNYSIYHRRFDDGRDFLFSYFEYLGDDFDADMAGIAADPVTQEWWAVCKPCQQPFQTRAGDEWWAGMEEVFHTD